MEGVATFLTLISHLASSMQVLIFYKSVINYDIPANNSNNYRSVVLKFVLDIIPTYMKLHTITLIPLVNKNLIYLC